MTRTLRRARFAVLAVSLVLLAVLMNSAGRASEPSSTGQAGYSYLLWARDATARIWVLDAGGGLVREHVLSWPTRGQAYVPRELMMGPDGTRRLLWTNPELGRSVAWLLDDSFNKVGETVYQAASPAADWYTTNLEKNADGTGRLLWFNGQVGSGVVWGLDAADNKVSTRIVTPAADVGAWVPIDYSRAPDGSGRLVWTYVWNGTGPWGGKSVVWFLDGSDQKLGSQTLLYEPNWFLRTYHFGNDGRLRFLLGNDAEGKGKVCTALTDTTVVPAAEGWGVGKCKTYGPQRGWILRSHTGNVPLDLSAHERAMIERESQRLGIPEERFISPTKIRYDDFLVSTDQLGAVEGSGDLTTLNVIRWPLGRMYLSFHPGASQDFIQNTLSDCQQWASAAGVSCLSGNQQPRLEVRKAFGDVCISWNLGYRPGQVNFITTDEGGSCGAHELGHALGLIHTHQREDRDAHVQIHLQNARPEYHFALEDRFRVEPFGFGPYDLHSIMHYGPMAFTLPGIFPPLPTITRLDGSTDLGGSEFITVKDRQEMNRLYPGTGEVSPAHEFAPTPDPNGIVAFFVSHVRINGQNYTPAAMPGLNPGDTASFVVRVTNQGRTWLANEGLFFKVTRSGDITLTGGEPIVPVDRAVLTDGLFAIPFDGVVPASAQPSAVRLGVTLFDTNQNPLDHDEVHLYIGSGTSGSTGAARVLSVNSLVNVVPLGGLVPFEVKVDNPTAQPETVRVRGYIDGAIVTDHQPTSQVRTLVPGQAETFTFTAVAPDTPGSIIAYGQLYTLTGSAPYGGAGSADVMVTNPPSCGGCSFFGVPCGQEGRCLNNPALGCGFAHVCASLCQEDAEVQYVTTVPNPVAPHAPFTVTARVKNLSAQVNTFSVRAYANHPDVAPADAWHNNQAMQPLETRDFGFTFTAPASGTFQSFGQVFCPGAPLPFVGNESSPVTVGGGGGPYNGLPPSADVVYVGPQPAAAGGTISLYARVHNQNSYTTAFYLRPYSDAPTFQELPRFAVSIPPHSDITEHIEFPVPNQPGALLDLHYQVEYTVGTALSGNSATDIPIGSAGPSPSPTPPPEPICPGPDDGDHTGCPLTGQGHQTYRSCQSCRSAHTWASSCKQKQELDWCWKPL